MVISLLLQVLCVALCSPLSILCRRQLLQRLIQTSLQQQHLPLATSHLKCWTYTGIAGLTCT